MKWKYLPVPRSQNTSGFSSLPDGGALNLPWNPTKMPLFTYGGNDGGAKTIPEGPSLSAPSGPFGSPGSGHDAHGSGRKATRGCTAPLSTLWPVGLAIKVVGKHRCGACFRHWSA